MEQLVQSEVFWYLFSAGVLIMIGFGGGRLAERHHYTSIQQREEEFNDLVVMTSRRLPPDPTDAGTQMVMGGVVVSVDYFKRFVAYLRMVFGGRVHTYESLLDRARREAILRMQADARALGATMIFNTRFETSSVSKGGREQSLGSVEVVVYGTAVIPALSAPVGPVP